MAVIEIASDDGLEGGEIVGGIDIAFVAIGFFTLCIAYIAWYRLQKVMNESKFQL